MSLLHLIYYVIKIDHEAGLWSYVSALFDLSEVPTLNSLLYIQWDKEFLSIHICNDLHAMVPQPRMQT